MKRRFTAFLGLAATLSGAAVAVAAPPLGGLPIPQPANQAVDQAKQATSNAQKSVDARKDAPTNAAGNAVNNAQKSANNAANQAQQSANQAADQAQQSLNNAADRTQDAASRAVDQTNRAANNAANQAGQATNRAADQVNRAANNAADQTQRATDRAGNAANRAANQAADQTNRAVDQANQGVNRAADQAQQRTDVRANARVQANSNAQINANLATRLDNALGIGWTNAQTGLALSTVAPNSLWANAGLQPGDQIVSVGGRQFTTPISFYQYASTLPAGQRVPIIVTRNGTQQTLYWTPDQQFVQMFPAGGVSPQAQNLIVTRNSSNRALGLRVQDGGQSVVVVSVVPGGPADQAQIRAGDQILAVNGQDVFSTDEFIEAVAAVPANAPINLAVSRTDNVQVQVQTQPSNPIPVTAARPIMPPDAAPIPATRGQARRFFRRY